MPNPAEGYESYMVPTLFAPCATALIEAADPRSGERVLDLGCGTGIVARQVASSLKARGKVTGIDVSPNMLAVAKVVADREGLTIGCREGNAEQRGNLLAAGIAIGNGGDDFEWMDSWEITQRDRIASGTSVPKLRSDALLVSKSEAASALIYWNGKRYIWRQQGD